jgi:hypothetical protein
LLLVLSNNPITCFYLKICIILKKLFVVLALYGFYATTTSPTTVAVNPYPYNVIEVDADLSFNSASANTYKCLQSGIYWIFMTVVWDGLTWSGFNLNGLNSNPQPTVFRQHTMFNSYDTLSRDFIRQVNSSQVLSTQSQYPTWANNMTGTAWGAFQIDNLMTQTVSQRFEPTPQYMYITLL